MSSREHIELHISPLGRLFGYKLEAQTIPYYPNKRWTAPDGESWWPLQEVSCIPKLPVRVRGTGLFGPTAPVEIFPRGKTVRTPNTIRMGVQLLAGRELHVGVLILHR